MNSTERNNMDTRLRRSIKKGIAMRVMNMMAYSSADNAWIATVNGLARQADSITSEVVQSLLDDWKVTERPRGERRVK